ncbi:MAG: Ig-like domain-containing protein [Candidatus Thorarchaeota archaeon]
MPKVEFRLDLKSYKSFLIVSVIVLSAILAVNSSKPSDVYGHTPIALPMEIYSIWNDTAPNINGRIHFNTTFPATEWNMAAIYNLYDYSQNVRGKVLIQNDDTYLYIGMDVIAHIIEDPILEWGASIYLDCNHNGLLDTYDRALIFTNNITGEFVEFQRPVANTWVTIEDGTPGTELPTYHMLVDTDFASSTFLDVSHRQYEFRLRLSDLNIWSNEMIGIQFEATNKRISRSGSLLWPFVPLIADTTFRTLPKYWGDLHLGDELSYVGYVIEDNFNIKSGAIGKNNGTFLALGDIQGDGDQELIVASNRTVTGDRNLMAIYDYIDGEITQIWNSWESAHYSSIFLVQGMATFDFNGDGKDEIYAVSTESDIILRFTGWNNISGDFDTVDSVFTNYGDPLMGYIAIGDALNTFSTEQIVFGDSVGYMGFLEWGVNKKFTLWGYIIPADIDDTEPVTKIHDILVADMDNEPYTEVLMLSQFVADDSLSTTRLQVIEHYSGSFYDNWDGEDDLPIGSDISTEDSFGHTIIAEDVDNDGYIETILVGKDYLKIFTPNTFTAASSPQIEIDINDGMNELNMGGGAAVMDLDNDLLNELIVGFNNGTVAVYEFLDGTSDAEYIPTDYTLEWKGDLGSCFGKRGSIVGYDIDEDGEIEAIMSDNFGQIMVLGRGPQPDAYFTSPSNDYVSNNENILLEWEVSNSSLPISMFDVYVNGDLVCRAGSGQRSVVITLSPGDNYIDLVFLDITAKVGFDSLHIQYIAGAPSIDIYSPTNNYLTGNNFVTVYYTANDPQGDLLQFEIYRNGTLLAIKSEYSYQVDFDNTAGIYNITVVAVDTVSGDKAKDMIYIIFDNTDPTITITSPLDGSAVKSSIIEVRWTASDDFAGLDYYDIYRDGSWIGNTSSKTYDVGLSTDKEYIIEIIAFDNLGHSSSDSITIVRDTIYPTVELTTLTLPKTDQGKYYTSNSQLFVEWDGYDNIGGSGLNYFEIKINDIQVYVSYDLTKFNTTIDLGTEGTKEIVLIAWDNAGNNAIDSYVVALDTSNPIIAITSPTDGFLTSAENITIIWTGSDAGAGIKEYQIYLEGTLLDTVERTTTSYLINIPDTKSYTVTVVAVDYLDRTAQHSIEVIHDPLAPTFYILNPTEYFSYSSSNIVSINWGVINIFPDEYHLFVNNVSYANYSASTYSAIVNLGTYPPTVFPTFNITIAVYSSGVYTYIETRFITLDQAIPNIAILTPDNASIIVAETFYTSWSGFDEGSGLEGYKVWFGDTLVGEWDKNTVNQYIDISEFSDGIYNLTVEAFDYAGNHVNATRQIEVHPSAPEFNLNLGEITITNDPNVELQINIFDPHYGVKSISVVIDNLITAYFHDYGTEYLVTPEIISYEFTESDFATGLDVHNITITIMDRENRWNKQVIEFILDTQAPSIYQMIFNNQIRNLGDIIVFNLSDEPTENHFDISISSTDTYGVSNVYLNIFNDEVNETIQLNFNVEQSLGGIYTFDCTVDLNDFEEGNYNFRFLIFDTAGNVEAATFTVTLQVQEDVNPSNWFIENLFTIVIPSASGVVVIIILSIIISVVSRKRGANRGWEKSIKAVAYVTKTGLTCAYVPYTRDMFEDEQLFGGALTGIVGILGEITGETNIEMKVHVMEYGGKRLMICPGIFGNSILLVDSVKPIVKEKLMKFTMEFELTHKFSLTQDLVNLNDFDTSNIMVESYFGPRENIIQNPEPEFENYSTS